MPHQMRPVHLSGFAVPFQAPEDDGAGNLDLAAFLHHRFIEWLVAQSIGFQEFTRSSLAGALDPIGWSARRKTIGGGNRDPNATGRSR